MTNRHCFAKAVTAAVLAALFAATPAEPQGRSRRAPAAHSQPRSDLVRLRARVEGALDAAHAQKAYWGVLIADARTGQTLFELNPERAFVPASNTKLFTTALAMAALGPDYHFRTTVESRGALDPDGRLHSDLSLVGRGDPDLSNRKFPYEGKVERDGPADNVFEELADAVVAKGVKEIDGDIVGDDSYFAYDPYPASWTVGDLYFSFGAPVSAIAVNDNTLAIEVKPGEREGAPALLTIDPWAGYETFGHEITTGPIGSKPQFEVVRQPGPYPTLLRGSIPLGAEPAKLALAMQDPAEYAAHLLKRLLEARGVRITGQARAQHALLPPNAVSPAPPGDPVSAPADSVVLAEHLSPPLLELVRLLNKISQNLHAELLLRAVARGKTGVGSTEAGLKVEQEFLKSIGIADGEVLLADGSGLSGNNLVTPRATVSLLRWVVQQPWGDAYVLTLPVAGQDGTLETRMKGTAAAGHVRGKTGALEHVRAISGFATTLGGERLVFAMFGNNNPQSGHDASATLDAIAVAMVEEIGAPPRAKARPKAGKHP